MGDSCFGNFDLTYRNKQGGCFFWLVGFKRTHIREETRKLNKSYFNRQWKSNGRLNQLDCDMVVALVSSQNRKIRLGNSIIRFRSKNIFLFSRFRFSATRLRPVRGAEVRRTVRIQVRCPFLFLILKSYIS